MPLDQSAPRTDHSGSSPNKAHAPGVKQILRESGLEIPLINLIGLPDRNGGLARPRCRQVSEVANKS